MHTTDRARSREIVTLVLVLTIILGAFGFAGQGDYVDALRAENVAMRRQLKVCRAGLETAPAAAQPGAHQVRVTRLEDRP